MMEMLTHYNSFVSPHELEMIDVHDRKTIVPSEVKGTPTLVHDGQVYSGDYAFDLLADLHGAVSNMEVKQQPRKPGHISATPQAEQATQSESVAVVDDKAVAGLFDTDPMMPRS